MTISSPLPDEIGYDQPELFPEAIIYLTIRVSADGRWSDQVRISTPDGQTTFSKFGRSGGIMLSGEGKCQSDLATAFEIARQNLEPFVIVQGNADSYPC